MAIDILTYHGLTLSVHLRANAAQQTTTSVHIDALVKRAGSDCSSRIYSFVSRSSYSLTSTHAREHTRARGYRQWLNGPFNVFSLCDEHHRAHIFIFVYIYCIQYIPCKPHQTMYMNGWMDGWIRYTPTRIYSSHVSLAYDSQRLRYDAVGSTTLVRSLAIL